jgi:hypothetical protein
MSSPCRSGAAAEGRETLLTGGIYADTLVRTAAGWRITDPMSAAGDAACADHGVVQAAVQMRTTGLRRKHLVASADDEHLHVALGHVDHDPVGRAECAGHRPEIQQLSGERRPGRGSWPTPTNERPGACAVIPAPDAYHVRHPARPAISGASARLR